jgi:hypothetical protein
MPMEDPLRRWQILNWDSRLRGFWTASLTGNARRFCFA